MLRVIFILIIFILSGCSNYKSNFDCKPGLGLGCTPARKAYKIINSGDLKQKINEVHNKKKKENRLQAPITRTIEAESLNVWLPAHKDQNDGIIEEQYLEIQVRDRE